MTEIEATEFEAGSAKELEALEEEAMPGDVIVLKEGEWKDQVVEVRFEGTAEAPVTIRSRGFGRVIFTGRSSFELKGAHVVVDGLLFHQGQPKDEEVIYLRGHHCRLTQSAVIDFNPEKPTGKERYHWVRVAGHHNRVDHCAFAGQATSGVTLVVTLEPEEGMDEVAQHRIDHNYFGPRPRGKGNGYETIRIGTSEYQGVIAKCVVEDNLFERCDGEIEVVSNKSGENLYRRNTFREVAGCLTLRHGNNCRVEDNIFLGGKKKGTGGIRIVGEGHVVKGNYVTETDGRAQGAIAISGGVPNAELNEHQTVRNVTIEGNVLVNNRGFELCFDHGMGDDGRSELPEAITVTGNRFVDLKGEPDPDGQGAALIGERGSQAATWEGNEAWGKVLGIGGAAGNGLEFHEGGEPPAEIVAAPEALTLSQVGPGAGIGRWLE